jgi:hypothetical protein
MAIALFPSEMILSIEARGNYRQEKFNNLKGRGRMGVQHLAVKKHEN